jgi:hypothetical protein
MIGGYWAALAVMAAIMVVAVGLDKLGFSRVAPWVLVLLVPVGLGANFAHLRTLQPLGQGKFVWSESLFIVGAVAGVALLAVMWVKGR